MSKGINKVILLGHVGNKYVNQAKNGNLIVKLSIATNEDRKIKETGQVSKHTEWHNVVFFGKLAEIVERYVEKGKQVYVEGEIRRNKYVDKNGNECESLEIIAREMQICGTKDSNNQQSFGDFNTNSNQQNVNQNETELDDLPF